MGLFKKRKIDGLRIYRKICKLVRIVEVKDDDGNIIKYLVQSKDYPKDNWKTVQDTISLKKAIQKKHFQVIHIIGYLGYRETFLEKRKKRRNIKKQ